MDQELSKMTYYQRTISEATGVTDMDDLREIEDYMRHVIYHSTLDWQTKVQLSSAARKAWKQIQLLRSRMGTA